MKSPKGPYRARLNNLNCKSEVSQGPIKGPILFNLILQELLEEVFPHGDINGVHLSAQHITEECTLRDLEYDDDLVLVADSPETVQELLTRLVTALQKYNMKIAPTKIVWMHVRGGEANETLTAECERIVRVQHVTYFGSVLEAKGNPQVGSMQMPNEPSSKS